MYNNYIEYKKANTVYSKIFIKNKKQEWKNLCGQFNFKTKIPERIFIKTYKNKKTNDCSGNIDPQIEISLQEEVINKLYPPSRLHSDQFSLLQLQVQEKLINSHNCQS